MLDLRGIHWVIVGGESGFRARPMNEAWVVEIRQQCRRARMPFFFKQWGGVHKSEFADVPTALSDEASRRRYEQVDQWGIELTRDQPLFRSGG